MSGKTMLDMLDQIDNAPVLPIPKAEKILGVSLQPIPQESTQDLYIFRGHGGLWTNVELRLPAGGDGSRFLLVLVPATPIPMKEITTHFGEKFGLESPNPAAGDKAAFGYSYQRRVGKLRFAFKNFDQFAATTILFNRM